jgi:hypothetical protein
VLGKHSSGFVLIHAVGRSNGFALQLRGHDGRRDERAQI